MCIQTQFLNAPTAETYAEASASSEILTRDDDQDNNVS